MEMQQMLERLLAGQARFEEKAEADRKADQEDLLARMDAMFETNKKRMMACLGQTEANTEKIDPGMMQSIEEH
jgi:hypothetical protein